MKTSREDYLGYKTSTYTAEYIDIPIDLLKFKKICTQSNLVPKLSIELKDYLTLDGFLTLDIIQSNIHTRPICFSSMPDLFTRDQLQLEGVVYRLVPLDSKTKTVNEKIEASKSEVYYTKHFKPVRINYPAPASFSEDALYGRQTALFASILKYYNNAGDKMKANAWAKKFVADLDLTHTRYSLADLELAEQFLQTDIKQTALDLVENIANTLLENYRANNSFSYYQQKAEYENSLLYLADMVKKAGLSANKIEDSIEKLNKE